MLCLIVWLRSIFVQSENVMGGLTANKTKNFENKEMKKHELKKYFLKKK